MSLTFAIDHVARVIRVRAHGRFSGDDLRDYQTNVRSLPEYQGFHEVFDLTDVEEMQYTSRRNVQDMAALAARNDLPDQPTYLAIVAPHPTAYGLARMYQTYREMDPRSTRIVRIFRSRDEAEQWLASSLRHGAPDVQNADTANVAHDPLP
jgi:hypothetical protein